MIAIQSSHDISIIWSVAITSIDQKVINGNVTLWFSQNILATILIKEGQLATNICHPTALHIMHEMELSPSVFMLTWNFDLLVASLYYYYEHDCVAYIVHSCSCTHVLL